MPQDETCNFQHFNGQFCQELREGGSQYCFFHDSKIPKNTPQARQRIIEAIKSGKYLDGAYLEGADLSYSDLPGARLVKSHLERVNFERSNLEGAHLYGANLRGANLFNANLRRANLKETNMAFADILEMKIDEAKILGINWGKRGMVRNELEGLEYEKKRDREKAKEKFREAEEIYRNIRIHLMAAGIFAEAADFFYREMVTRRKQLPLFSMPRLSSKVIDLLCGYGEKTFRVIGCAALFVWLNSIMYFLLGIRYGTEILRFEGTQGLLENAREYLLSLYFSVVTLTTLGYGDIAPIGASRFFAATEAFLGAFMMALFVLVFGRKMIR